MKQPAISHLSAILLASTCLLAMTQASSAEGSSSSNSTSSIVRTPKLISYAGSLLPEGWLVLTTINDRAVIGFNNGSAINININDLNLSDRLLVTLIRRGDDEDTKTTSNPTGITREKLSQWSSQFTSTVSKLGKSLKDQFDSFINNHSSGSGQNKNGTISRTNETIVIT